MEHIGNNLNKYSSIDSKHNQLKEIKQKILSITGIEPESVKLNKNVLTIKCKNNYEALELRSSVHKIAELKDLKLNVQV